MKIDRYFFSKATLIVLCFLSFSMYAEVVADSRERFKTVMEVFGKFIDSGQPFTLAEFFSVDSIPMPSSVRTAFDRMVISERSLDVSLEDQSAILQFGVELFGQRLIAKLRIGLEYPVPKTQKVDITVPEIKRVSGSVQRDIQWSADELLTSGDFDVAMSSDKKKEIESIAQELAAGRLSSEDVLEIGNTYTAEELAMIATKFEQIRGVTLDTRNLRHDAKESTRRAEQAIKASDKKTIADMISRQEISPKDLVVISERGNVTLSKADVEIILRNVKEEQAQQRRYEKMVHMTPQKVFERLVSQKTIEKNLENIAAKFEKDLEVITQPSQTAKKLKDTAIGKIKSITPRFSLLLGLPDSFKFSAIDSKLSMLDLAQFHKIALIISQTAYKEPDFGVRVDKGLNIVGSVKIAGPLERLSNLIGQNLTTITVQGLIDPAIFGSRISGIIPGKLRFGKNIRTGGLKLHLYLKEVGITVGIETGLEIKPPKQDDWLEFVGEINVALEKASLEFSMRGMWENVFGIPGPKIGNLKFKATTDYAVAAATEGILTLSGIGLGGELGIGSKSVAVNVYGEISETEDILIDGAVKGGIFLDDIVTFAFDIVEGSAKATQLAGRAVNKDFDINKLQNFRKVVEEKVPKLGFETAHLSISPKVMWFGGKKYDGVEFDLITYLFNKKVTMHMKVDKSGIDALGAVSSIKIGPVKITGAGADKTSDTDDDGPVISLAIKPGDGKAELFLNGKIEAHLFGKDIVSEILADISPLGVHTRFIYDIGMFKTHLELSAKLKEPKDFFVKARMEQDALDTLSILLEEGAKEMVKRANRDLADARAKVKGAYKKVQEAKQKIKELSAKRRTIEAENKASIAKALINIQPEVARYERTKAELKDAVAECKGKAPKEASSDIDEKSAIDQESALDKQKALNELKNAGLNQNQIDAIRYEINRKIGR